MWPLKLLAEISSSTAGYVINYNAPFSYHKEKDFNQDVLTWIGCRVYLMDTVGLSLIMEWQPSDTDRAREGTTSL